MTPSAAALPAPLRTPLLRDGGVLVKPEGGQPGGSVKYRMVHALLCAAIERGELASGTTLVEATAGSTGVALALAGRSLGLPVELHAFESADPEKCASIRGEGATLVLHPVGTSPRAVLERIGASVRAGGYWHLGQYDRSRTAAAYDALADELVAQLRALDGPPRTFACTIGTGGLIQSIGGRLRRSFEGLRVVAVEPAPGAHIDGVRNTEEQWMGEGDPYDRAFPDERVLVASPPERMVVGGTRVGWSATAAIEVARTLPVGPTVVIAAD